MGLSVQIKPNIYHIYIGTSETGVHESNQGVRIVCLVLPC